MTFKQALVVNRDADFVESVTRAFREAGLDVGVASTQSGEAALEMLGSVDPDVVIVDAELPGMDGYTLTQVMKSRAIGANVPVVIMSPHPTDASAERARAAGASAHVSSVASIDTLVSNVAYLVAAPVASSVAVAEAAPPAQTVAATAPAAALGGYTQASPAADSPASGTRSARTPSSGSGRK